MAGAADIGIPNGLPVDEWGIRVAADKCTPVGASVARGGATNCPAAVFALTKYVDWMKKYAPPQSMGMTFSEAGPVPARGEIAQQIFWYTAFTAMAAAWLYAQFVTSKSVSLEKSIVGLTFIRDSDIRSDYFTKNAAKYGGLIEFDRSPARVAWTPTGTNVSRPANVKPKGETIAYERLLEAWKQGRVQ